MIAERCDTLLYATLWERTRDFLAPLGTTEMPVPSEWAATRCPAGRVRFSAACWHVGQPGAPRAVCRVARLQGAADGLMALIGPRRPGELPIFTAELLATEEWPPLACLDLRAPGLPARIWNEIAEQTTVLAIRHAMFLPRDEPAPAWAVNDSPGGYLFTRTAHTDALPRLAQAYEDYLNIWLDFAHADPAIPLEFADAAHVAFCRSSAARESMLERYFGETWTRRFLAEFWYA